MRNIKTYMSSITNSCIQALKESVFMRLQISFVFFILLFYSCTKSDAIVAVEEEVFSKPNILLILADDMGLDATPGYNIGSVKPNMPTLQSMMNSGVKFDNLWSYPTCSPTRASILTGKYGSRTNVLKVDDELSTSEISLQKFLDTNNSEYNHAVIGKWHLSKRASHPTQMGVGYYAGNLTGGVRSYTNWNFTENGVTSNSTEYTTTKFTDLAINWIKDQDKPWFLWLAYNAPHAPFHLPPSNLHTQSLPSDQASIDASPMPYYMAMIEAMDTEIGRLLSSMSQQERDNTIIIFIGDNGTPGQVVQQHSSRRAKGSLYEGGVNVPMIISGKGVDRINQSESALINTTDLFATIADIADTGVTSVNDSKSFKSLLSVSNPDFREYSYSEKGMSSIVADYTIRNSTHKYMLFENGDEAFYDMISSPFETINLLSANQSALSIKEIEILQELKGYAEIIKK